MKIVIDISKHIYDCVIGKTVLLSHIDEMCKAIKEGTPLPKGHGDLIDRNEINIPYDICDGDEAMCYVNEVSPIIEADKGER